MAEEEKGRKAVLACKEYFKLYGISELDSALDGGFADAGFRGAMKRCAEALAAQAADKGVLPTDVATLYAYAGDKVHALDWLERAYEERDPNLPYLRLPSYDTLRSEPRFRALERRLGIPPG